MRTIYQIISCQRLRRRKQQVLRIMCRNMVCCTQLSVITCVGLAKAFRSLLRIFSVVVQNALSKNFAVAQILHTDARSDDSVNGV